MEENSIRVLLCDDHDLFRSGLLRLLEKEPDIYIVGEAGNGREMLDKYDKLRPDLLLIDISMPVLNGTEAVKILKETYPLAKVLFLSMFFDDLTVYYSIEAGGNGLIDKKVSISELIFAIRTVFRGNDYFGPLYDKFKIKEVMELYEPRKHRVNEVQNVLTKKEEEIVLLIGEGLTSLQIADDMGISKRTIDCHRYQIMKKLKLKTLADLVIYALKHLGLTNM